MGARHRPSAAHRRGRGAEQIEQLIEGGVPIEVEQRIAATPETVFSNLIDPAKFVTENGAEYPRSGYGEALRQIAQLIKADVGLEIAFAEAGGWDTHVNQGASAGQLAQRLDDFGRGTAIAAPITAMATR